MTQSYQRLSGFTPENESDILLRLRVLAGEIYRQRSYAEFIKRQILPTTAQDEFLDAHAVQRGLHRKAGTKAEGEVVFTAAEQYHDVITIPRGTVVCTAGDMRRFVTNEDAVIDEVRNTVAVGVTAVKNGSAYNVAARTVGIIVTPVIGVGSVTNTDPFIGGTDDESDDDLRQRVCGSYAEISNGTNKAYYRATALSVEGVYSVSVVGGGRGDGTVDVYACGQGGLLSAEKLQELQDLFDEARELNVDVLVQNPTAVQINLYIGLYVEDGYNLAIVSDAVRTKVRQYISSLGIGQDVLLSNVGDIVHHTEGVADYRFQESYGANRTIADSEYAVPNNILVGSA